MMLTSLGVPGRSGLDNDKERHLVFIVAGVPIGVLGHVKSAAAHDDGAGVADGFLQGLGPDHRLKIGVEVFETAVAVVAVTVQGKSHAQNDFCQRSFR